MRATHHADVWNRHTLLGLLLVPVMACGGAEPQPAPFITPVYNAATGRLAEILSDRDGDGRAETRAYMEGTRLVRIEIDRDGDGHVDRWEYYSSGGDPGTPTIERAEERGGAARTITRRETFVGGVLQRVEEDTTSDGQPDKWETYEGGRLAFVDLDLAGQGRATRRLVYGGDGNVVRMEADPDGDGTFTSLPDAEGRR